jgi:hypothetical protein
MAIGTALPSDNVARIHVIGHTSLLVTVCLEMEKLWISLKYICLKVCIISTLLLIFCFLFFYVNAHTVGVYPSKIRRRMSVVMPIILPFCMGGPTNARSAHCSHRCTICQWCHRPRMDQRDSCWQWPSKGQSAVVQALGIVLSPFVVDKDSEWMNGCSV